MKTRTFAVIASALLIVSCVSVSAQESNRDLGAVDASVHASAEAQPSEPELPQGVPKRITPFSNWSSQPTKPSGSMAGWPTTSPNTAEPTIGNKLPFSSFRPGTQTHDAARPLQPSVVPSDRATGASGKDRKPKNTGVILSGTNVLPSSPVPAPGASVAPNVAPSEIQILRSPFEGQHSEPADIFSQTSPFPRKGLKAKQHKPRPLNSTDFGAADPLKSAADSKR